MRCASCGFENPERTKFCGECGRSLTNRCPSCGVENPPPFKFCGECGAPLTGQLAVAPSSVAPLQPLAYARAEAERRQLTVLFCDLVGSTALSTQLDPEELREVIRAYQETCTEVIQRYGGHIAQHLGDGLLIYFGYPVAHEDDARRAVRTGLEIIEAFKGQAMPQPLQVRIGIHTGLVVIGEIGAGGRTEQLALGETPNLAARIQGQAQPDEVVISAATYRLVEGLFACKDRGQPELKGVAIPLTLYHVVKESEAQSRFDVAVQAGLTPLVGREEELALLRRRRAQATEGEGQVVLLSGEAGIGKSRLVQELKDRVAQDSAVRIEFRCSPYHQNSAFYPLIEHIQQVLHFAPSNTPQAKLQKLEQTLARYRFPQSDTVPLLAALLSLPQPEGFSPLSLTLQQQKQKTLDALLHWLFEEAERATVYTVWEDLHWADPSTLEFLALCLDQVPTARMLMLLTFRPEFTPPWASRSHVSHLVLSRLGRKQMREMVGYVAVRTSRPSTSSGRTESGAKGNTPSVRAELVEARTALPSEIIQQIVSKTDGVPLFVEELTKSVMESVGAHGRLQSLDIPATLQDSLMARLDRLGTAKEVAQQGAVVGRELTYEVLRAISPLTEATLQHELTKLVEAELLYQRGLPPQATYFFKHALVQETAYQSLLKSKRQQYHRQIAEVFETRFPQTTETQPELLAQHYTEAGLMTQALPYWQRAGQRAIARSANLEAIRHLTRGLEVLTTLPDIPARAQQELDFQLTLGPVFQVVKGPGAPEAERTYARARDLCQQVGETPQLFPALWGLWYVYLLRTEYQTARELGEQLLHLAQRLHDPTLRLLAYRAQGQTLCFLGEFPAGRSSLEQAMALYNLQQHRTLALHYGQDPAVLAQSWAALALWLLGYPDQARQRSREAISLARELAHPYSLSYALHWAATVQQFRREPHTALDLTETVLALAHEQGFALFVALGTILQGWALSAQSQGLEGMTQIRAGIAAWRAAGSRAWQPYFLGLLAEAYGDGGHPEEGLQALAEALAIIDSSGERLYAAELYRLKGELLLQQLAAHQEEAEACFRQALDIARRQQAKSLELRATVSLARLWQQQGKPKAAHAMLGEIYNWFTEGFDTKDLQEAKTLLDELSGGV